MRQVASVEKRVNEARRMGFSRVIIPKRNDSKRVKQKQRRFGISGSTETVNFTGIDCIEAEDLMNAIEMGLVSKIPKKRYNKAQNKQVLSDSSQFTSDPWIIDDDEEDDDEDY